MDNFMRSVVQRVLSSEIIVGGQTVAKIGRGLCALVGIAAEDADETIDYMLEKIINLRIFDDADGKMNLSLSDINGGLIIVPNFTLCGDARKGRRPDYTAGAKPSEAALVFERLKEKASAVYDNEKLGFGIFQADMLIDIKNDGPVTILLDSERIF